MSALNPNTPRASVPLNGTFDYDGHIYRDARGNRVPSVTQTLKRTGLVSYEQVQADILENRRNLGEIVHRDTAEIDTGEISFSPTRKDAQPYVNAWKKFLRESNVKILGIEVADIATVNGMPYGYTFDRVAIVNGREAILELKTSATKEHWWGVQAAGYDLALPQCSSQLHRDRYVIQLRDDEQYRMWKYDDESDYLIFQFALATCWWCMNHGYSID